MIEFYIDTRVVLIPVFAHRPLTLRTLPFQGITTIRRILAVNTTMVRL